MTSTEISEPDLPGLGDPLPVSAPEGGEPVARGLRGPKLVMLVAGVAVVCLVGGLLAGRLVKSPAQAAAEAAPPPAGPVTVRVEKKVLSNDVTLRADAVYADAVEVRLETGDLKGPAVVTGQVPEVGAELGPGSVLLEIAGRPVIMLPGELPVYRTMRSGTSGPDVAQLKAALASLGIDPGDAASDVYDAATAKAVDALYAKVGYASPEADEEAATALKAAKDAVRDAEDGVAQAEAGLNAGNAASNATKLAADQAIGAAERALAHEKEVMAEQEAARAAAEAAGEEVPPAVFHDIPALEDAIVLAKAQRAELDVPADTTEQQRALDGARRLLRDARESLVEAQDATLTALPASEVVFAAGLPRRVDYVMVARGQKVDGPVAAISGAALLLKAGVSKGDSAYLKEGAVGEVELGGVTVKARISSIGNKAPAPTGGDTGAEGGEDGAEGGDAAPSDAGRVNVTLEPIDLTPEQVGALRGQNVKVRIEVGATNGEVLVVPNAALSVDSGEHPRVEVLRSDRKDTELVNVEIGLQADGFVEITSADGELAVGDRVVVGK